jgi:hypothetical protein
MVTSMASIFEDKDDKILNDIEKVLAESDMVNKVIENNEKSGITDPVTIIEKGVRCDICKTETLRYYPKLDLLKCDKCECELTGYQFITKRVSKFCDGWKELNTKDLK